VDAGGWEVWRGEKHAVIHVWVQIRGNQKKGNFFCGQTALNWLNDVLHNDGARQNLK